jgi:hypothetical protein
VRAIANGIQTGDLVQCQVIELLLSPTGNQNLGHTKFDDIFLVTQGATSNFFQSHVEVLHLTLGRVRISASSLEVISAAR